MGEAIQQTPLVLGTAGHIDHGKSTLIEALTGTDPDRLEEEKRRGITITLGFAKLQLPDGTFLGVVDVPGHERFVRQMIAGASGIDLALLCIAADDGVMPQTREHLAILELLGITTCVVALTKCDLVDNEWIEMVTEEIRSTLAGTPYANSPIIPVSAYEKTGLEELRNAIAEKAGKLRSKQKSGPVRMPIDRVFTIKGSGTVVTGTLWQGSVRPNDTLEVLPTLKTARIRNVQVHGQDVPAALGGNRTALNISNLSKEELAPGDFLATPGTLDPTDRFDARFKYLPAISEGKPLKSGTQVRVAHGTREVTGRLLLMDGVESLKPLDSALAQIRLDEPLPISRNDRFVVRSLSPIELIGGGIALDCHPHRRTTLKEPDRALLEALSRDDDAEVCKAVVEASEIPVSADEIARTAGLAPKRVDELMGSLGPEEGKRFRVLVGGGRRFYATSSVVQRQVSTLENLLLNYHAGNPASTGLTKGELKDIFPAHLDDDCFDALLSEAESEGKLVSSNGEISHPQAAAGARSLEDQTVTALMSLIESHGATPPSMQELFDEAGVDSTRGYKAIGILEKNGEIVRFGDSFVLSKGEVDRFEKLVREFLEKNGSATAAQLKEAMGTSRKYAIPLLEYFDSMRVTQRDGDQRTLARPR
ncbi:MAG: selenocysteine-specific translation elongation factor [Coriobacteriales bacterium]|jgi:selenocysteine-specific elongation factor